MGLFRDVDPLEEKPLVGRTIQRIGTVPMLADRFTVLKHLDDGSCLMQNRYGDRWILYPDCFKLFGYTYLYDSIQDAEVPFKVGDSVVCTLHDANKVWLVDCVGNGCFHVKRRNAEGKLVRCIVNSSQFEYWYPKGQL